MVSSLVENIAKLYFYIAIGTLIGIVFKKKRESISKIATWITINLITPIVIFLTFTSTNYEVNAGTIIQIILLEICSVFFGWLTTFYALRNKVEDRKKLGAYFFLNGFPNIMIYGIPVVIMFFDEGLIIFLVIFASSALVMRGTFGMYLGEKFGADVTLSIKNTIKKLISFPPLLGIIAGVIGMNFIEDKALMLNIKNVINPFYSALGAALIGLILSKITKKDIKTYIKDIGIVSLWRFVLSFGFYMCVVFFLHFPEDQTAIRTLLMISVIGPPAVMNVSFAIWFKLDEKFAAISVATITLMALILLPLIVMFGSAIF